VVLFLPLSCLCFALWLVPCRFGLVPASWLGFAACLVDCLVFVPCLACICLVVLFLPLSCLCFALWLVPCRFVLVPASWLGFAACLSVVGGLARFRAVSCLHLPSWLGFGSSACMCFVARLFPCRFVLVPASWLGFAACLPVALRFGPCEKERE